MKITKRQLVRIIREEVPKSTEKYDDNKALKGDQDELPDELQKGIIDKAEQNEASLNTGALRKIIREELLNESMVLVGPNLRKAPIPLESRAHSMIRSIVQEMQVDECPMDNGGTPLATAGDEPFEIPFEMPCPHNAAEKVRAAGATPDEVMTWLGTFLQDYLSPPAGSTEVGYNGDMLDLSPEEAFGLGYMAGEQGLE